MAGLFAKLTAMFETPEAAPQTAHDPAAVALAALMIQLARAEGYRDVVIPRLYAEAGKPDPFELPARAVTDVVIRAYRQLDIDLQQRVHEDMRADFDAYPPLWGLTYHFLEQFFSLAGRQIPVTPWREDL